MKGEGEGGGDEEIEDEPFCAEVAIEDGGNGGLTKPAEVGTSFVLVESADMAADAVESASTLFNIDSSLSVIADCLSAGETDAISSTAE